MKILVVRTDRMGDVLLSTPVPRALKKASRDNHVTMMLTQYAKPIVEKSPYVDDVFEYASNESDRDLIGRLRRGEYDVAILLHPTFRLAWVLARAHIPRRIGTASRVYSVLFNERISMRRSVSALHEVECNLAMVKGLCGTGEGWLPEIFIDNEEKNGASENLENLGLNSRRFAVIHPGSGGSARNWPVSYFSTLADAVSSRMGVKVLVTGGPGEEELISEMTSLMSSTPVTVIGGFGIRELAAVLQNARLLVTNSTGPMHLATAVGTPVVAIFCPIVGCSPGRWGPLGNGNAVLMPDVVACKKCIGEKCVYYDCMERVSVDSVLGAVKSLLTH